MGAAWTGKLEELEPCLSSLDILATDQTNSLGRYPTAGHQDSLRNFACDLSQAFTGVENPRPQGRLETGTGSQIHNILRFFLVATLYVGPIGIDC